MPANEPYRELQKRLYGAVFAMVSVLLLGGLGYHALGQGRWSLADCFYMTVITLSTVGYGEVLPGIEAVPYGRLWTVGLILLGSGTLLYGVSTLTAIIVEGDLKGVLRSRRMQREIESIKDHIIVCGAGTTGVHAIRELISTRTPFVVIDRDEGRISELWEEHGPSTLAIHGEAHDDTVLTRAGIERARGVLVMLHEDRDNVYCTLTARSLNPRVRIISKAIEHGAAAKLERAGADRVVSPNFIGGMRLVSEMLRPSVVEFLDTMLRGREGLRIEEVRVEPEAKIAGKRIGDTGLNSQAQALVLAVRTPSGEYRFKPAADFRIDVGMSIVLLAPVEEVLRIRTGIQDGSLSV